MQWITQVSGIEIPPLIAEKLEKIWASHNLEQLESGIFVQEKSYDDEIIDFEGKKKAKLINYYERKPALRYRAIEIHGTYCKVCGFDFGNKYGIHGEGFIEVHHLKPLSSLIDEREVNPLTDMTVLCANCHRMAHRFKDKVFSLKQLKKMWAENNSE